MTHIAVSISYNSSVNSHSLSAYSVQLAETDAATKEIQAAPETWNNRVSYAGVVEDMTAAVREIARRIGVPFLIIRDVLSGEIRLAPIDATPALGWSTIARHTDRGMWIAA